MSLTCLVADSLSFFIWLTISLIRPSWVCSDFTFCIISYLHNHTFSIISYLHNHTFCIISYLHTHLLYHLILAQTMVHLLYHLIPAQSKVYLLYHLIPAQPKVHLLYHLIPAQSKFQLTSVQYSDPCSWGSPCVTIPSKMSHTDTFCHFEIFMSQKTAQNYF